MRDRYPKDWPGISLRVRTVRAAGRCECTGWCGATPHGEGRCEATNGQPHPLTGSKVVLTVAHLNRTPEDCRDENLAALCQRCHLAYDAEEHRLQASHTRAVKAAGDAEPLFPLPATA
jgi:hypothetical protein